eukprot:1282983-Prymnesium_polylepis.2
MGMEEATSMADPVPDVLILLPLNAQEMTVTLLLPLMYIPPPCKGEDNFSSFMTLQRAQISAISQEAGDQSVNPTGPWKKVREGLDH